MLKNQTALLNTRFYYYVFAILSAIGLLAPIRLGELPGYDDARYALVAKGVVVSGDWLTPRSNGYPDFEHPPLFEWMQAACFSMFGISDPMAKLPSTLCGLGVILLVGWLGRRLTGDSLQGVLAMFVMATTAYFVKYTARAMTDVPVTFFFLAAICAWSLVDDDPRWYLATGAFTAMALMTRGLIGFALPVIFGLHLLMARRRPHWGYLISGLVLAILPLTLWYARLIIVYGQVFFDAHSAWLGREVYGALSPAWRRYTGLPEYVFMVAKSYWPWLPFMITAVVVVIRNRQRQFFVLVIWIAVVLVMCAAARSRVLRYMLPAYPAFAILAAIGLAKLVPERFIRTGFAIVTPVLAVGVLAIAIFPPNIHHAAEIRPIAVAATAVTPASEGIELYDSGQPRYDETNQMQWYGGRTCLLLMNPAELEESLRAGRTHVFVLDDDTYRTRFNSGIAHEIVARSGRMVCIRLKPS